MDLHVAKLPGEKTVERISYRAARVGGELPFLRVESPSGGGEGVFRFGDHFVHARTGNIRVFVGDHSSESEVLFNEVVRHPLECGDLRGLRKAQSRAAPG